jgi:hypothetical protein
MPLKTAQGAFGTTTLSKDRSGRRSVAVVTSLSPYKIRDGVIMGPGSASGVKVRVTSNMNQLLDNVPQATTRRGAGSLGYHVRNL